MASKIDIYQDTHADQNKMKLLVAGGLSAAMSRTAAAPLLRVTILFQVQTMNSVGVPKEYTKGIVPAFRNIFQNEGVYGLFKGNLTSLVKKVPFAAIKFLSYERYKQIFTPSSEREASVWGRLGAGAAAATTAVIVTYPLDFVQTQLAVQTTTRKYTGILNTISTVTKQEGISQLYRGFNVALLSTIPYIAINMTLWEHLKKLVRRKFSKEGPKGDTHKSGGLSPIVSALCGAVSGAVASTITFPLDVLRRHMQLNSRAKGQDIQYASYLDCIRKIYLKDGVKGFYRGIIPHYLAVIPVVSLSLGSYDLLKVLMGVT
mmetsp:Transcript_10356/g.14203  ORF Transcript_10356/g.14203 Transcript_10356/m.14203 type:complete len:317 (+) Transcript_10356:86-1036(+)